MSYYNIKMSSSCNGCKKCISFGSTKKIEFGRTCSEPKAAKKTKHNLWKRSASLSSGRFTTNSKKVSGITQLCINDKSYLNNDASGWLFGLNNNYETMQVELISIESSTKATYNITNSTLQPFDYRGFSYVYKRIYGDDPSINQIVIHDSSITPSFVIGGDNDDDFAVSALTGSDIIAFCVLYGDDDSIAIDTTSISQFVTRYIDNVLYNGSSLATIEQMESNFTNNFSTLSSGLPLYVGFKYPGLRNSDITVPGATGINFYVGLDANEQHQYLINYIGNPGEGYDDGEIIEVTGINNAPSDYYNATFTVLDRNSNGGVTGASVTGTAYVYSINDGGNDQYDGGNELNNDFNTQLPYTLGNIIENSFGSGSKYFTSYKDSIFTMITTGNLSDTFYLTGNLGSDGDGYYDGGFGISASICADVSFVSGSGTMSKKELFEINILPK